MRTHCCRRVALISTAFVSLALASAPAEGQMVVYDPSNYAQNVLQAAREKVFRIRLSAFRAPRSAWGAAGAILS